jgi:hypothetical protein
MHTASHPMGVVKCKRKEFKLKTEAVKLPFRTLDDGGEDFQCYKSIPLISRPSY